MTTPVHSPEYYRDRAARMRGEAKRATNDALSKMYIEMADQWEDLAEKAEKLRSQD